MVYITELRRLCVSGKSGGEMHFIVQMPLIEDQNFLLRVGSYAVFVVGGMFAFYSSHAPQYICFRTINFRLVVSHPLLYNQHNQRILTVILLSHTLNSRHHLFLTPPSLQSKIPHFPKESSFVIKMLTNNNIRRHSEQNDNILNEIEMSNGHQHTSDERTR